MKKYIVILLFLAALLMAACSKLDISPKDEISDKEVAYKNPTITRQILAGIYSLLYNEGTWGSLITMRNEAATDVTVTRATGVDTPENNSHTTQSAQIDQTWSTLYRGINAANEFVYYSEKFTPPSPTRTQMVGEARFLRAYFYFTLVRLFGDVPFRTEPTTNINSTDIARTSAVVIYDFIVKELVTAQQELNNPLQVAYGRISKTAAQTALADVYLNLAGTLMTNRLHTDSTSLMYERAAFWCEQVLANTAHNISKTEYATIFMNQVRNVANVNEQIWELQPKYMVDEGYRIDSRLGKYNGMQQHKDVATAGIYQAGGYLYHGVALRKLYSKVNAGDAATDVRLDWNCPLTRIGKGSALGLPVYEKIHKDDANIYQAFQGKWRTIFANTLAESFNLNYSGTRLSMYRIADVHLMYAEALSKMKRQADALVEINKVRVRAKASVIITSLTEDQTFELIVDERARELCFEGKRRFDLIRWGKLGSKIADASAEYKNPATAAWVTTAMLAGFNNFDEERHYIFPIPQNEIARNALIPQEQQNKGWGGNRAWK